MMNRRCITMSACRILCLSVAAGALSATTAAAQLGRFAGDWVNADPTTLGTTSLQIRVTGTTVRVRVFGSCAPQDCDWGWAVAHAYTPVGIDASLAATATAVTAIYVKDFATMILIFKIVAPNVLTIDGHTRFTDGNQRSNLTDLEFMHRR